MATIDLKVRLGDLQALAAATILALFLCLTFSAGAQASGATVVGWGLNGEGQLGNGTVTPKTVEHPCECIPTPGPVSGLSGATQIAAGGGHVLALLADGTVMAWGENFAGELGNGTTDSSAVPVAVSGLHNVVAVSAGVEHSLALLENGTVMAWGANVDGQLGNGENTGPAQCGLNACTKIPVPVPGLANVVAIAATGFGSVALLADGTVMAWGLDESGELGDGTGKQGGCRCATQPTPVPGVSGAIAIAAGRRGAMALLGDGSVKAWGRNERGQLGAGAPSPDTGCRCMGVVSVNGLLGARAVVPFGFGASAMLADGSVQAWGLNFHGELGIGKVTTAAEDPCECIPTPTPVSGLSGVQAIAGGFEHSLALLPDGSVDAWGNNEGGGVGDGTTESRSAPIAVKGVAGASGVAAGINDSFALIGPSQALRVSLAGAGTGTVGTQGIRCPPSCNGRFPQGQVETLRAQPASGSGFAGFSGVCSSTAPCQVKLDRDQSLTATFGPPKGTKITRAKISGKRRSAAFSFSAPGAITGFQCKLIRPRRKARTRFSKCAKRRAFRHLPPGRYTFKVRALDVLGADAHPAVRHFEIRSRSSMRILP